MNARVVRGWVWIALAMGALLAALAYVVGLEDEADIARVAAAPEAPVVSVVSRRPATETAQVAVLARLTPLWSAELRANIGGRILSVSENALAGRGVAKGQLLLRIEDSAQKAGVVAAGQALEEARFALVKARNRSELARRAAERAGDADPSDLSLHLPELRIAEHALANAEAQLAAARATLAHATVAAPFDGVVTKRAVSPGQTVSPGDALLTMQDSERFELNASFSAAQWRRLDAAAPEARVMVETLDGAVLGRATVRKGGALLDPQTRERALFLEISRDPAAQNAPLIAGEMVRLRFRGRRMAGVLRIPEASLTRDGEVWEVDAEDRLRRFEARLLWRDGAEAVIAAPQPDRAYRIVLTPLAGHLPGQRVAPKAGGES